MNSFSSLRKEIQKYIYDQGWKSLTKIQEVSIEKVNKTNHNLVLEAPTASGKTEAAFLPVINNINDWNLGIKIVYISPLVALINDQFKRISDLCKYLNIEITSWHGEAPVNKKNKLMKDPKGILLITPESIEAMLVRHAEEAKNLFNSVEWVIVDEIHSFLDTSRGVHLQSLIQRISLFMKNEPRFIAMSATLNNEDLDYLKNFFGGNRKTIVLLDKGRNSLEKEIKFYPEKNNKISYKAIDEMFLISQKESMLIFPNARGLVEEISVNLKKRGRVNRSNVVYFAHHSSVDKHLRLEAEKFAKDSKNNLFTICCTSTLELGIDIGSVDSVIQYGAPNSVSTLGQRLGRSGRKNKKSKIYMISGDKWSLLQSIAAISLYDEGKIDLADVILKPYDVLAQQILSLLIQTNGIKYDELLKINYKFNCWRNIEDSEVKILLDHLLKNRFIELIDDEVIIGLNSEKFLHGKSFYTHFDVSNYFSILYGHERIGEIPYCSDIKENQNILLSARIWKIKIIELKSKKIRVIPSNDGKAPSYTGEVGNVSNEVRTRMKEILSNERYFIKYDKNIRDILKDMSINHIETNGFYWVDGENNNEAIRTFAGTKINKTILFLIYLNTKEINNDNYYLNDKKTVIQGPNLKNIISDIIIKGIDKKDIEKFLLENSKLVEKYLVSCKYRELLPDELKVKYIVENIFDIENTRKFFNI